MPTVNKEARAAATKAVSIEISSLEKRLQESSKVTSLQLLVLRLSQLTCCIASTATFKAAMIIFSMEKHQQKSIKGISYFLCTDHSQSAYNDVY